jgi:uncharacterized membrane protein YphA (DoxX/SURF4 family)
MNADTATAPAGTELPKSKSPARHAVTVVRILMGLMFFSFGLMFILNKMPQPKTPMPEGAANFAGALMNSGYMMQLVMGTQFTVGLLLLINRFVPLALALIMPIIVGIVTFHVFLEPAGIGMAIFVLVLELFLAWSYRSAYRPMLQFRTIPG